MFKYFFFSVAEYFVNMIYPSFQFIMQQNTLFYVLRSFAMLATNVKAKQPQSVHNFQ